METIWYVFKKFGGAPSYKHASYESAVEEAKRLVDAIGGEYEILRLESVVKPSAKYTIEMTTNALQRFTHINVYDDNRVPF